MRVFSLPPRSIREVEVNWFANKRTKKKKKKVHVFMRVYKSMGYILEIAEVLTLL